MFRTPVFAACALLLAAAPDAALAQPKADEAKERARIDALRAQVRSYRCVTKGGRKYYGSTVPPQCMGELVEALSAQGMVLFRIEPPLTPEQRAAKAAEARKADEAEAAQREAQRTVELQARRDRALLQTYTDESDIERVRQRALASNRQAAEQVEARIAQLNQRQEQFAKQAAKYKDPSDVPEKFKQDVKAVAYDLSLQEQLLESRRREAAEINARYDEEKRKYRELTGRK
jgi:flagellar biosynthesis GTPase FlhF